MGMVLRFPIERARSAPAEILAEEPAQVLILPTVRIERDESDLELVSPELAVSEIDDFSSEPSSTGNRRRRRTPRS